LAIAATKGLVLIIRARSGAIDMIAAGGPSRFALYR